MGQAYMLRDRPGWLGPATGLLLFGLAAAVVVQRPHSAAGLLALPPIAAAWMFSKRDAVTVLAIFVGLLFLIPQRYVIGPLGGVGVPAVVVGLLAFAWWSSGRIVPAMGLATGTQPIRSATAVFAFTMTLSYAVGMLRPLSPLAASGADRRLILLVALWGVALLATDGIQSHARLHRLLMTLVVVGGVVASIGIVQYTTGFDLARQITPPGLRLLSGFSGIGERAGLPRVSGTAQHAIEFGLVLAMLLPVALHYAWYAARRARRVVGWAVAAAIAVAIPLALARSAVVAAVVGLVVLSIAWPRKWRWRLAGALVTAALLLAFAAPAVATVIFDLFAGAGEDPSVVNRVSDIGPVLDIMGRSPYVGIGLGTFSPAEYFVVDNQYLVTAMESGILGVLGLVTPFVVAVGAMVATRRRSGDEATRHLSQALTAAVAVSAVGMASFGFLSFKLISGATFLVIGIAGALWRLERDGAAPAPPALPEYERRRTRDEDGGDEAQEPSVPAVPTAAGHAPLVAVDAGLTARLRRALEDPAELERVVAEMPALAGSDTLSAALADELTDALDPETVVVWLPATDGKELWAATSRGLTGAVRRVRVPVVDPLVARAVRAGGRPVAVRRGARGRVEAATGATRFLVAVALTLDGRLFGLVTMGCHWSPESHGPWLGDFADQAAAALAVSRRVRTGPPA